ncbi:MAG: hypothetical protein JWM09_1001 [Francisellaceae bacterium]|nr:hypothetical protein [Francisellaceae bacterium]
MVITAALVKELRERTNAGMMECKKALTETSGDIEKAIENMRKSGLAKAVKKAGRIAAEGTIVVLASSDNKKAIILEINCETDFVAREEKFKAFAKKVAARALEKEVKDIESLIALSLDDSDAKKIEESRLELISQLGENITIRRIKFIKNPQGLVGSYGHGDANGVRIGALVSLTGNDTTLANDLPMQVAAMNPEYLKPSEVDNARKEKEKEIYLEQTLEKEGDSKPREMIDKIVESKLKKFVNEISLLTQTFVKENNKTIETLLKEKGAEILEFVRFEVGEGIEKKEDNFVEEVMMQARGE